MRLIACLAVIVSLAPPALAQTDPAARVRMEQLQQQNMRDQARTNAASRDGDVVNQAVIQQQRRQTQDNLQAAQPTAAAATDTARIAADEAAISRLREADLNAGNARLRAITPAAR